jgi:hypothetical protein
MSSKILFVLMIVLALLTGCASNRDLIAKASLATRNDVFTEASNPEAPAGKAIADITFTVKSNSSRFMWITSKHTYPPYNSGFRIQKFFSDKLYLCIQTDWYLQSGKQRESGRSMV